MAGIIDCQHVALEILGEVILPPGGVPGIPQADTVYRTALVKDIADVPGGEVPSGILFFRKLLAKKGNGVVGETIIRSDLAGIT